MAQPEKFIAKPAVERLVVRDNLLILGTAKPSRGLDDDEIRQKFQKIVNRIVETEPSISSFIEVKHNGQLFRVEKDGHILMLRDSERKLLAASQIITSSIPEDITVAPDEVVCYRTIVKPGAEEKKYTQVMDKAQEVIARSFLYKTPDVIVPDGPTREYNKIRMTFTVQPEDTESIRSRLKTGFRIVGYEEHVSGSPVEEGAKFMMEKSLHSEPLPFDPVKQSERIQNNETPILSDASASEIFEQQPTEVAIPILTGDAVDLTARQLAVKALEEGYLGTGLLQPQEWGHPDQSLLIFQQAESHPIVEKLTLPLHIKNDFGKLREVIVSYSPFNQGTNIEARANKVSTANEGNVDCIAIQAEHEAFVKALESVGAHVVRTSSFPNGEDTSGKTSLFTRDPGVVVGDTFIVGKMGYYRRNHEPAGMRRAAEGHSFVDFSDENGAVIEGGDIMPLTDNIVLVGLGKRTNQAGAEKLAETFPGIQFVGVPHEDLHLDVLFTVVGEKKVLADIELLPDEFIQWLHEQKITIIEADPEEQPPLGVNVLAVDNNKVIAVAENPNTNQRLRDAGVEVIEVSMPNIIKEGGGPRCITCPTNRD